MEDTVSFNINPIISFKNDCILNAPSSPPAFSFKEGEKCEVKKFIIQKLSSSDYETIKIIANVITPYGEFFIPISYFKDLEVVEMRLRFLNQTLFLIMDNVPLMEEEIDLLSNELDLGIKEIKSFLTQVA